MNSVNTYVVSTAECERSFSIMNDILTAERNGLTVQHLSELLFIKSVGPPLSMFYPENYVVSWLNKGRRSALPETRRKVQRAYVFRVMETALVFPSLSTLMPFLVTQTHSDK
jgi:hypothetical protein